MAQPEAQLESLGIELPGVLGALGNYLPAKRHGDTVYLSGHGPLDLTRLQAGPGEEISFEEARGALIQGKVGAEISQEDAVQAARTVGLFLLASLRAEIGSLDRVSSVLKVFGMVNCAPGFGGAAGVIDGCSDLLVEVFGEDVGRHARSAPGMAELPLNVPVVIDMVVAVET